MPAQTPGSSIQAGILMNSPGRTSTVAIEPLALCWMLSRRSRQPKWAFQR